MRIVETITAASILALPGAASAHLLISEFVVTPTDGEFVEIYNPGGSAVDLSDYYLSDAIWSGDPIPDYVNLVDGSYTTYDTDFLAQFPSGATIGAYEAITVAVNGAGFETEWGVPATYELIDSGATTDMVDPGGDWIGAGAGITNSGEVLILFHWDGMSDLIQDVDIALWGDKDEAVDKTGVAKDGPDGNSDTTTYADDTDPASQSALADGHAFGNSFQRVDCVELSETSTGGNGIDGDDETSEDFSTWTEDVPTPNVGPTGQDCTGTSVQSMSWTQMKARAAVK